VYAVMIVVLKVLTREDTALMPKGDKIAKVLHIS
jgi:stage V sporulation protein B